MDTKQIQHLLGYLGYYALAVDGSWGTGSRESCRRFQEDYGLEPDAIPGTATQRMLLDAVSGAAVKKTGSGTEKRGEAGAFWESIRYFRRADPHIGCPCGACGGFPAEPTEKLMRLADAVRAAAGKPMLPTSTVRCRAHNAAVGGVGNSRHLLGQAMDFGIPGLSAGQILAIVRAQPQTAYCYAIDSSHVHMDVLA